MLRKRSSDSEWKLTSRKRHAPIWLHEFKSTEDDVSLMENNPKRKWDEYCWECHKDCDEEVKCSKCVLSFHSNCMPDINRSKPGWICPECISAGKFVESNLNDNNLDAIINYAVERVIRRLGKLTVPDAFTTCKLLVNPLTISDIVDKATGGHYEDTHSFHLDFKWFRHNSEILFRNSEKGEKKAQFQELHEKARNYLNHCTDELSEMKLCGDCYINLEKENAFIMVCSKPHLVLWVKYKKYPHWPAKLKKIVDGRNALEVQFFGDHTTAKVSNDSCFLYSKEDPNIYCNDKHKSSIREAVNEAEKYIINIEEKFGRFLYASKCKIPMAKQLDTVHLDEMIPGFRNPNAIERSVTMNPSENFSEGNGGFLDHEDIVVTDSKSKIIGDVVCENTSTTLRIRMPQSFIDGMKECREYVIDLEAENYRLREENEALKAKLDAAEKTK